MKKKNVAVVAGGYSSEYVVSLKSAEEITQNIDRERYTVYMVLINQDGWEVQSDTACGIPINKNDFSFSLNNQKTKFAVVYMSIHGTPGEDGKLQAYFEILNIPVTTGNTLSMALSFDKFYCNQFLKAQNIVLADSLRIQKGKTYDRQKIIAQIGLPLFVQPANAGSSFGISKVKSADELPQAIDQAFKESPDVLIEQFIKGREFSVGIFISNQEEIALPVTEIISKTDFFDYAAKYTPSLADEITPAEIPQEIAKEIQKRAMTVYKLLNIKGITRIDFIWTGEEIYFLEINTVPGMSKESIAPKQIRTAGYSLKDFYTKAIEQALNNG